MRPTLRAAFIVASCFTMSLWGTQTARAKEQDNRALFAEMHPKTGLVQVANGLVSLNIGPNFKYLDSTDATTMVVKILHNPPSAAEGILGMIVPTTEGQNWFAVIEYSAEGHVPDNDAASVNYDELLKEMQKQSESDAKERRDAGFAGAKLVGWAQKPYYDSGTKKIYWAKSIQFDDSPNPTLNYDVRILGRTGFLNIKIVDSIDQLNKINAKMPEILTMANFTQGNTYADYVSSTDHTAAYGIAGLVAGGVLAKAGFFKGLLVVAAAFWKLIAVAVMGFLAAIGNFFRRRFGRDPVQ